MQLYQHQRDWLNTIRSRYQEGLQSVMAQAPTGFGKTVCFAAWATNALRAQQSTLILVHRQEIYLQTAETVCSVAVGGIRPICSRAIERMLYMVGSQSVSALVNYRSPIRLAMVQTLAAQKAKGIELPRTDWLIVDEAHHSDADTYADLLRHYRAQGTRILGVTATPERQDGRPLSTQYGGYYDGLVDGPSMEWLVSQGYLSLPHVIMPDARMDLGRFTGRMDRRGLGIESAAKCVYGDAVAEYRARCPGEPAVVFTVSIKAAKEMADRFQDAGFVAHAVDGQMREDERRRRIQGLGNGSVHVVASCDLISEGMDVPAVRAAFLLRPTESRGLHMQQVGRCLRTAPGKENAIIVDHAGNCMRHGHPLSPMTWGFHGVLECDRCRAILPAGESRCHCGGVGFPAVGRQRNEAVPAPKVCQDCLLTWPAHAKECGQCGQPFVTGPGRTIREVQATMEETRHHKVETIRSKIAVAMADVWLRVSKGEEPEAAAAAAAETHGLGNRWVSDTAAHISAQFTGS